MTGSRAKGSVGEDMACAYLTRRGYRILERNYYSPYGEVDVIASRAGWLVFCEVKARSRGDITEALEAVDLAKQRRIAGAASHYLFTQRPRESRCRFDVIALLRAGAGWKIEHVEDAFEMGDL